MQNHSCIDCSPLNQSANKAEYNAFSFQLSLLSL